MALFLAVEELSWISKSMLFMLAMKHTVRFFVRIESICFLSSPQFFLVLRKSSSSRAHNENEDGGMVRISTDPGNNPSSLLLASFYKSGWLYAGFYRMRGTRAYLLPPLRRIILEQVTVKHIGGGKGKKVGQKSCVGNCACALKVVVHTYIQRQRVPLLNELD